MTEIKYLDYAGVLLLVEELRKEIADNPSVEQYESLLNFPSIGKEKVLYIDQTNNKSYRWDDTESKYFCVGSNYEDITLIKCGGAS